jgi:hypothetical protein
MTMTNALPNGVAAFGRKPHFVFFEFAAFCRGAASSAGSFLAVSQQFRRRERFAPLPVRRIE